MNLHFDAIALGELLIDFTPIVDADDSPLYEQNPGGAPANVMVAMARLGASTSFIGKVGDDPFGHFLANTLKDNRVDVSNLLFSPEYKTTLAFVHLTEEGDRSFSFYRNPGADRMLDSREVDIGLIRRSRIFHFGSISFTHEPARTATWNAAKHARESGLLISYDPNLRLPLWKDSDEAKKMMLKGLEYADVVKLSEEELEFLTGAKDVAAGLDDIFQSFDAKIVLVTLGEKGCIYRLRSGGSMVHRETIKVDTVDSTGAGDAFFGAFLWQILRRRGGTEGLTVLDMNRMVDFANVAGALSTTKRGAIPSFPSSEEIERWLGLL